MTRRAFNFPWRTRRRIAADVDDELAFHIESRIRDLMAAGETHADAEARALREFGDLQDARRYMAAIDRATEHTHRRREHMRDLWQNVRYALRRMRTAPVFTVTAIATLAIGIGANTAVFSIVDAALIRRLPYPNAERVVAIYDLAPFGPFASSAANFTDYRTQTRSFDAATAFYGLGTDYDKVYPRKIRAVTQADVLRAARAHLHPDNFLVVAVGRIGESGLRSK